MDGAVLCWCFPLNKCPNSGTNITEWVSYFLSRMGCLKNTFLLRIRQLCFSAVAGKGGEAEVLTSELLSCLSFLPFLGLGDNFVCHLGLTCGCVSYLAKPIDFLGCIKDPYMLMHLHHICWKPHPVLHTQLQPQIENRTHFPLVTQVVINLNVRQHLACYLDSFCSSVQMKVFERTPQLEGRWQTDQIHGGSMHTLPLSWEKGRYRFWKALEAQALLNPPHIFQRKPEMYSGKRCWQH